MWTFEQSTGKLTRDGKLVATGWAGHDDAATGVKGFNNAAAQNVHNVGPLPQGEYTINSPQDTTRHGPYVLWLTPNPDNEMFGRSGFGIHGAEHANPLLSSDGCIIMPRFVREQIWKSFDDNLTVVPVLVEEGKENE